MAPKTEVVAPKPSRKVVRIAAAVLAAYFAAGIGFPSADGFNIYMDFSAVWGILPHQALLWLYVFPGFAGVKPPTSGTQCERPWVPTWNPMGSACG